MKIDTKKIWRYVEWGLVILIALFGIWFLWFRPLQEGNRKFYDTIQNSSDKEREAIKRERDALFELKESQQMTIDKVLEADSLMKVRFMEDRIILKKIDEKLNNIPIRIQRIINNNDSLRAVGHNL